MTYPEHNPLLPVVAVDFDGVLAQSLWPSPIIGAPDYEAFSLVHYYHRKGCEIIVFTARPESHHARIWEWLVKQGLDDCVYDVTNVKPVACLYFDDRAVRWPL